MRLMDRLKKDAKNASDVKLALQLDSAVDKGLERNGLCNALTRNGKKGKHLYKWEDVAAKYKLSDDFFEKYTKEKGAMLQAIIKYEATRENAVKNTLFFKELAGELPKGVNIDETVKNAKENQKNTNFAVIYENSVQELKDDKVKNKASKELFKIIGNSSRNKGLEITDAIDKMVMDALPQDQAKTLSPLEIQRLGGNTR